LHKIKRKIAWVTRDLVRGDIKTHRGCHGYPKTCYLYEYKGQGRRRSGQPRQDRRIRDRSSRARNHAIPIIALTALAMKDDKARHLQAGMNTYITQPVNASNLLAIAKKITR